MTRIYFNLFFFIKIFFNLDNVVLLSSYCSLTQVFPCLRLIAKMKMMFPRDCPRFPRVTSSVSLFENFIK